MCHSFLKCQLHELVYIKKNLNVNSEEAIRAFLSFNHRCKNKVNPHIKMYCVFYLISVIYILLLW